MGGKVEFELISSMLEYGRHTRRLILGRGLHLFGPAQNLAQASIVDFASHLKPLEHNILLASASLERYFSYETGRCVSSHRIRKPFGGNCLFLCYQEQAPHRVHFHPNNDGRLSNFSSRWQRYFTITEVCRRTYILQNPSRPSSSGTAIPPLAKAQGLPYGKET